jgi:integrase
LPSEVSRIRYEDLKQILVDYYREKAPDSLYKRRTKDGGSEETFLGADKLGAFFKRMPVTETRADKIQAYIKWRHKEGDADATTRRQLGHLRLAFNRAWKLERINRYDIPPFELPTDSKPRVGDFSTLRDAMPEHLRLTLTFLYYTRCRTGAASKITWEMVSRDCTEIELPAEIMKNDEPLILPLVGPLEGISPLLKEMRKVISEAIRSRIQFSQFSVLLEQDLRSLRTRKVR